MPVHDIGVGSLGVLAYRQEVTFGTAETGAFAPVRQTGNTLSVEKESVISDELRADRQIAGVRHVNRRVEGSIDFELSYGSLDDLLEVALLGEWDGYSNELKSGNIKKSATFERQHPDVGQYIVYRGCRVNSLSLTCNPGEIITGSMDVIGVDGQLYSTSQVASVSAPLTTEPMVTLDGTLSEGGSVIAIVTGLEFSVDNGYEPNYVIGQATPIAINPGRAEITGTLSAKFKDGALLNKFLNETPTSLEFVINDPAGNSYTIKIPALKYSGASIPVDGPGDIIMSLPFQAYRDPVEETALVIVRS